MTDIKLSTERCSRLAGSREFRFVLSWPLLGTQGLLLLHYASVFDSDVE
jgi:hypothetical protein